MTNPTLPGFSRGSGDGRLHAPSAERNKAPILDVLAHVLPERGDVLEIASGTGQHIVHFATALPRLRWQPSDPDPDMRESIAHWIAASGVSNVNVPIDLDVGRQPWPIERTDAILCINMIHISPWQATADLMTGAGRTLGQDGVLFLYGPFRQDGRHTAPSNAAFDADLRRRNPEWGVRDLESVTELAREHEFQLGEIVPMPANNLSVVLRKTAA